MYVEVISMKNEKWTSVCNLICVVLLIVVLVMQFQPFWTCPGCKTHKKVEKEVSIAEYIWTPKHHDSLTDEMTDYYREYYGPDYKDPITGRKFKFVPNYILPAPLTVFLGCVVGIVGCVIFRKKFFMAGIPLVVGVAGMLGHLTYPAMMIGKDNQTHLILLIVVTAVAAISLIWGGIGFILDRKAKAAQKKIAE